MRWYTKFKLTEEGEEHLQGPFLQQSEALAAADTAEANDAIVVGDRAFEEADDYCRWWKPRAVAVASRADGDYQIYSDGTEVKL